MAIPTAPTADDEALIDSGEVKRLAADVCNMTISRWIKDGIIPPPLVIRRRNYWRRRELLDALAAAARKGA